MAAIANSFIIICLISLILKLQTPITSAEQQVPCYFIFGDSLVDNGNNNALLTQARVNYPPYGIDFPGGVATGRFTNGLNTADLLGQLLGFVNFIPPFATASIGVNVSKGVNYGSGGSGIRPETGRNLGGRISLDLQLANHGLIVTRITALQANKTFTREYLSKCIYTVGMGNNDYINNYFMPKQYPTSRLYTPEEYADVLIEQYSKQLKTLFKLYGARKIAISGLGLSGCTPAEILIFGADPSGCVDKINAAIALFNDRLKPLVDNLNANLTDAKFILINNTNIALGDPALAGITVLNTPCCVTSVNFGKGQCEPNLPPCSDRDKYIFFDGFHPTEIFNNVTASRSYMAALPFDTYPTDIRTLAQQ